MISFVIAWGAIALGGLFSAPAEAGFTSFCKSLVPFTSHQALSDMRLFEPHVFSTNGRVPEMPVASSKPRPDFRSQLDIEFRQLFDSPSVYVKDACHNNVLRLFRSFHSRIPQLRPQDFKVMIITPDNFGNYAGEESFFSVRHNRGWSKTNGPWHSEDQLWRFHFALVQKDRVYDLEYGNEATPINLLKYLTDERFIQPATSLEINGGDEGARFLPKENLHIYMVDGESYLWMLPESGIPGGFAKPLKEHYRPIRYGDLIDQLRLKQN